MWLTWFDALNVPALMCVHPLSLLLPPFDQNPSMRGALTLQAKGTDTLKHGHAEQRHCPESIPLANHNIFQDRRRCYTVPLLNASRHDVIIAELNFLSRRHVVLMSHAKGYPMYQLRSGEMEHPDVVYRQCVEMIVRLARHGLIHCDFNEFNMLVDEEERLTLIDFPQMVSTRHANAEDMFDR